MRVRGGCTRGRRDVRGGGTPHMGKRARAQGKEYVQGAVSFAQAMEAVHR